MKKFMMGLALALSALPSYAAMKEDRTECHVFSDGRAEWLDCGDKDEFKWVDGVKGWMDLREMVNDIWYRGSNEGKKPRPAHFGKWETKIYSKHNTDSSVPGRIIDDTNQAYLNVLLQGPKNHDPVEFFKSRKVADWFYFYPAGNDFYYLAVSGNDANGKYEPLSGLLHVDPSTPDYLRIALVRPWDWVPPAGTDPNLKLETPRRDFYLFDSKFDHSAYLFRMFPTEDSEGFYLQHAGGKWIGAPADLTPIWMPGGQEFRNFGFLSLVNIFAEKEFPLFTFRFCNDVAKEYRTCVKFSK